MKPLKIGITGVRGIVGETVTPELAVEFAESFGTYLDRGRILVCRDTRPSGQMIRSAVLAGLLAAGCEVIDLGMAHSVNAATIKGLETGLVNSGSIMVPCPWLSEIAAFARANPQADRGLHHTLTSELT